jgi:lactoylglutathione lyase
MTNNKVAIGMRIAEKRMKHGLSQESLGELLGVSRQSVSKWELGQSLPDLEKIVLLCKLWNVSTDEILMDQPRTLIQPSKHILNWGLYLIVKDFKRSIHFYEQLLDRKATMFGTGRFAQFRFNGNCILSIMSEAHLKDHNTSQTGDHKFALNLWTTDLSQEYQRVKKLNIGPFTDITSHHPTYYFFNLVDPDHNLIEITGEYYESGILN